MVNTVKIHHKAQPVYCGKINIFLPFKVSYETDNSLFEQGSEISKVKSGVLCGRKCDWRD